MESRAIEPCLRRRRGRTGNYDNRGNELAAPKSVISAVNAPLGGPTGVAVDGSGNIYVTDSLVNVVEKISYQDGDPAQPTDHGARCPRFQEPTITSCESAARQRPTPGWFRRTRRLGVTMAVY